jgi:hypothetical protein
MTVTAKIIPVCFYMIVGIVSLTMAYKNIFSNKFIAFQEQAAGKSWNDVEKGIQFVIIALMRVSGLGFLVVALLLMGFPLVNYFENNTFLQYAIPAISLLYCLGLFLFNYQLHVQTKVDTPWTRSLYAAVIIGAGLILSLLL